MDSTDQTKEIINNYKKQNNKTKIVFLNQTSKGIYNAWNQGLVFLLEHLDNNHFVTILNSDDWLEEDCLKKVSKYFNYDLVAGSCMVHYDKKSFRGHAGT